MDISVEISELNKILCATNVSMTITGVAENVIDLVYDPGALLPNVTLRLTKHGFNANYVSFKYEAKGASSFMLSAANFFSLLPNGIAVDKANKIIGITPSELNALRAFQGKCRLRYFVIGRDRIEVGLSIV